MTSIFILDNKKSRRENLARYLSGAGYEISGTGDARNLDSLALNDFDLVVLNLHPDADRTWEMHMWFKNRYPDLPVLVYMTKSFQAYRGLRQAISFVLNDNGNSCGNGCELREERSHPNSAG